METDAPTPSADPRDRELSPEEAEQLRSRDARLEVVVAAAAIVFGGLLLWWSRSIRPGSIPDPITSAGLPRLAGLLILALAGVTLLRMVRALIAGRTRVPSEGDDDEPGHPSTFVRPMVVAGSCLAWALLIRRIGFFLVTPLLILVVLRAMGVRSRVKLSVIPIAFTAIVWVLFYEVLGITFPHGFLDRPLRLIGFL